MVSCRVLKIRFLLTLCNFCTHNVTTNFMLSTRRNVYLSYYRCQLGKGFYTLLRNASHYSLQPIWDLIIHFFRGPVSSLAHMHFVRLSNRYGDLRIHSFRGPVSSLAHIHFVPLSNRYGDLRIHPFRGPVSSLAHIHFVLLSNRYGDIRILVSNFDTICNRPRTSES